MDNQAGRPEGESQDITLVLPIEAKARLERRRAEAELEFRRAYQDLIKRGRDEGTDREIEGLMVQLVYARFFAFAEEAVNSQSDTFTVRKILDAFLPVVVDKVFLDNHPDARRMNRNEQRARFHDMAQFILTNSPGWMELQGVLAERSNLELESLQALSASADGQPLPVVRRQSAPGANPSHPNRAAWLQDRLTERAWNPNDPARQGGPDRKTMRKILNGGAVREDVLEKLASALSKKHGRVSLTDIPRD
jgi:hypothetical protein